MKLTPFEVEYVNFLLNKPMLEKAAPAVGYVVKFASEYLTQLKHARKAIKMKFYYNYRTL